jgi:hypothetical protein
MIPKNDLYNFSLITLEELYEYYDKQYEDLWEMYGFTGDESLFEDGDHEVLEAFLGDLLEVINNKKEMK